MRSFLKYLRLKEQIFILKRKSKQTSLVILNYSETDRIPASDMTMTKLYLMATKGITKPLLFPNKKTQKLYNFIPTTEKLTFYFYIRFIIHLYNNLELYSKNAKRLTYSNPTHLSSHLDCNPRLSCYLWSSCHRTGSPSYFHPLFS